MRALALADGRSPAWLSPFVIVAVGFIGGLVVSRVTDDSPGPYRVTFLTGDVSAVAIDGSSLCLIDEPGEDEVCAPPALKTDQELPGVGDEVYVARVTVRRSDDDTSRIFVYVFPDPPVE